MRRQERALQAPDSGWLRHDPLGRQPEGGDGRDQEHHREGTAGDHRDPGQEARVARGRREAGHGRPPARQLGQGRAVGAEVLEAEVRYQIEQEAVAATGQLGFQQQLERTDGFIPDAAEISYILCTTSGSTGAPKPITLTQRVKLTRARIAAETYGLDASDCILLATPMHHTLAQRLFFLPMILGGCSVILPHFTPESWLDTIAAEKVTFTMAVSTQLSRIASFARADVDGTRDKMASLKAVVASSSALPDQSKREILALCPCDIHEMYGTSETATATDVNLNKDAGKQTSVGRPLPEVELRILSRDFTDQPTGEVGQIAVKTAQIFSGYEGMPSQTGAAMHGDFFLTGDLGYLDSDGFLYFSGRDRRSSRQAARASFPLTSNVPQRCMVT